MKALEPGTALTDDQWRTLLHKITLHATAQSAPPIPLHLPDTQRRLPTPNYGYSRITWGPLFFICATKLPLPMPRSKPPAPFRLARRRRGKIAHLPFHIRRQILRRPRPRSRGIWSRLEQAGANLSYSRITFLQRPQSRPRYGATAALRFTFHVSRTPMSQEFCKELLNLPETGGHLLADGRYG